MVAKVGARLARDAAGGAEGEGGACGARASRPARPRRAGSAAPAAAAASPPPSPLSVIYSPGPRITEGRVVERAPRCARRRGHVVRAARPSRLSESHGPPGLWPAGPAPCDGTRRMRARARDDVFGVWWSLCLESHFRCSFRSSRFRSSRCLESLPILLSDPFRVHPGRPAALPTATGWDKGQGGGRGPLAAPFPLPSARPPARAPQL